MKKTFVLLICSIFSLCVFAKDNKVITIDDYFNFMNFDYKKEVSKHPIINDLETIVNEIVEKNQIPKDYVYIDLLKFHRTNISLENGYLKEEDNHKITYDKTYHIPEHFELPQIGDENFGSFFDRAVDDLQPTTKFSSIKYESIINPLINASSILIDKMRKGFVIYNSKDIDISQCLKENILDVYGTIFISYECKEFISEEYNAFNIADSNYYQCFDYGIYYMKDDNLMLKLYQFYNPKN